MILYANSGVAYRSLSVEMSRFYPSVGCHNDFPSPPLYDSCKEIIDTMQWSETPVKFGNHMDVSLYGYDSLPLNSTATIPIDR